jgi:hypothetical protein
MPKSTRKIDTQWMQAIQEIQESDFPTLEIFKTALRYIDPNALIRERVELSYTAQLPTGRVIEGRVPGEWVEIGNAWKRG